MVANGKMRNSKYIENGWSQSAKDWDLGPWGTIRTLWEPIWGLPGGNSTDTYKDSF